MSHNQITTPRTAVPALAAVFFTVAGALVPNAHAASAAANTRIILSPIDRSTGGSSAGSVVFATDSQTTPPQTVSVNASAGNGSLSTFASGFAGPLFGGNAIGLATASLTDSFVVGFDGSVSNKILLDFAIHASGDASFSHGSLTNGATGGARVAYGFSVTGLGFQQSVGGSVERGVQRNSKTFQLEDFEIFEGPPLIDFKLTLEASADTANFFDLAMSSRSLVSVKPGAAGTSSSAVADFGSTFTWLGLSRAYLPDGTPYTGALNITSTSGFNYGQAIAPVPEPATCAMLLAGLGLIGWRMQSAAGRATRG